LRTLAARSTKRIDARTDMLDQRREVMEKWARLKPLGRQTRKHPPAQIRKLQSSIEQFGFVLPIVVDAEGRVPFDQVPSNDPVERQGLDPVAGGDRMLQGGLQLRLVQLSLPFGDDERRHAVADEIG
jgi:hypothetical protein